MADPQEALRGEIAEALEERVEFCACGCVVDSEVWQNCADAVLPVVQAHTQALRAERNLVESLRSVEFVRHREQYDRVLAWALRDQQRAGKAEDDLTALRDAVSRLADELEAKPKKLTDESAVYWRGRETAYRDAARRLRSLLGDKENN